jgi:hypothetical protein
MAGTIAPNIVTDGLILYEDAANTKSYPGSGTNWFDLAGSNNGVLTNGPTFSTSGSGCIVFDGVDDKVVCGTNISTANLTYPFSIDLWINVNPTANTTTNRGIFCTSNPVALNAYYGVFLQLGSAYDGTGNYALFLSIGNGTILGNSGRRSFTTTTKDVVGGSWTHIVGTISAGPAFKIYVNGVEKSGTLSGTAASIDWGTNTPTTIGQNNGSNIFINAKIANVKFYNTLLSSTQVLQNYNATKTRFGL